MITKKDLHRARITFLKWDNSNLWEEPSRIFKKHIEEKANDALNTAIYLYNSMTQESERKKILNIEFNASLWIINASYYSMFFTAQYLLATDNKKLPEGTKDTHKTTFLALLYYYIIKGSGKEGDSLQWSDIEKSRMSNALSLFKEMQEETNQLLHIERIKNAMQTYQYELNKRNDLTYKTTTAVELNHANTSLKRAKAFSAIIKEYLASKK